MRRKRLISLLLSVAIAATVLSNLTFTVFAKAESHAVTVTVDSENKKSVTVLSADDDENADFAGVLIHASYETAGGKLTALQVKSIPHITSATEAVLLDRDVESEDGLFVWRSLTDMVPYTIKDGNSNPPADETEYNISVYTMPEDTGKIEINPESKKAKKNDTVTVTAVPEKGYILSQDEGISYIVGSTLYPARKVSENVYEFTMPESDVTVMAVFDQESYSISKQEQTPNGTVTVASSALFGNTVQITAAPDEYCSLTSLTVKGTSENSETNLTIGNGITEGDSNKYTFIMPAENIKVEAVFEKLTYSITVKVDDRVSSIDLMHKTDIDASKHIDTTGFTGPTQVNGLVAGTYTVTATHDGSYVTAQTSTKQITIPGDQEVEVISEISNLPYIDGTIILTNHTQREPQVHLVGDVLEADLANNTNGENKQYQWQRVNSEGAASNIGAASAEAITYTITADDIGYKIRVVLTSPGDTIRSVTDETSSEVKAKSYTVAFDSNGGGAVDSQTVDYGEHPAAVEDPEKEGHTFAGWHLGDEYYHDITTVEVTENITFKAGWTKNRYVVSFNSNGGSSVPQQVIEYGSIPETPVQPTRFGYTFGGWSPELGAISGETAYTAVWSANRYDVTVAAADGGSVKVKDDENGDITSSSQGRKLAYGSVHEIAVTPEESHNITDLIVKETGNESALAVVLNPAIVRDDVLSYTFTMPAYPITVTPVFASKTYTVSFEETGNIPLENVIVNHGGTVTEPQTPIKDGYTFDGWYNGSDKYDFTQPVTEDITITGHWSVTTLTVTFDSDGGTAVEAQHVEYGQKAKKPTPDPTRGEDTFDGWYNGGVKYDFSKTLTGDIELVAHWLTPSSPTAAYKIYAVDESGEKIDDTPIKEGSAEKETQITVSDLAIAKKSGERFYILTSNTEETFERNFTLTGEDEQVFNIEYKYDSDIVAYIEYEEGGGNSTVVAAEGIEDKLSKGGAAYQKNGNSGSNPVPISGKFDKGTYEFEARIVAGGTNKFKLKPGNGSGDIAGTENWSLGDEKGVFTGQFTLYEDMASLLLSKNGSNSATFDYVIVRKMTGLTPVDDEGNLLGEPFAAIKSSAAKQGEKMSADGLSVAIIKDNKAYVLGESTTANYKREVEITSNGQRVVPVTYSYDPTVVAYVEAEDTGFTDTGSATGLSNGKFGSAQRNKAFGSITRIDGTEFAEGTYELTTYIHELGTGGYKLKDADGTDINAYDKSEITETGLVRDTFALTAENSKTKLQISPNNSADSPKFDYFIIRLLPDYTVKAVSGQNEIAEISENIVKSFRSVKALPHVINDGEGNYYVLSDSSITEGTHTKTLGAVPSDGDEVTVEYTADPSIIYYLEGEDIPSASKGTANGFTTANENYSGGDSGAVANSNNAFVTFDDVIGNENTVYNLEMDVVNRAGKQIMLKAEAGGQRIKIKNYSGGEWLTSVDFFQYEPDDTGATEKTGVKDVDIKLDYTTNNVSGRKLGMKANKSGDITPVFDYLILREALSVSITDDAASLKAVISPAAAAESAAYNWEMKDDAGNYTTVGTGTTLPFADYNGKTIRLTVTRRDGKYTSNPISNTTDDYLVGITGSYDETGKAYNWSFGNSAKVETGSKGVKYEDTDNDYARLMVYLGEGDSISGGKINFADTSVKEDNGTTPDYAKLGQKERYMIVVPETSGRLSVDINWIGRGTSNCRIYCKDITTDLNGGKTLSEIISTLTKDNADSTFNSTNGTDAEQAKYIDLSDAQHTYIFYTYQKGSTISAMSFAPSA